MNYNAIRKFFENKNKFVFAGLALFPVAAILWAVFKNSMVLGPVLGIAFILAGAVLIAVGAGGKAKEADINEVIEKKKEIYYEDFQYRYTNAVMSEKIHSEVLTGMFITDREGVLEKTIGNGKKISSMYKILEFATRERDLLVEEYDFSLIDDYNNHKISKYPFVNISKFTFEEDQADLLHAATVKVYDKEGKVIVAYEMNNDSIVHEWVKQANQYIQKRNKPAQEQ